MIKPKARPTSSGGDQPGSRSIAGGRSNAVQVKPGPPATRRGRATRQRLKDALSRLLQDRAFHQIRLEDITREAGVRVSLFYHYFPSKIDITQEVLSDLLEGFQGDVEARSKGEHPIEAIHYANQRMVGLYSSSPGAMRCLFEVHEESAPFASMWRNLTLDWNRRIATNLRRQFPDAFVDDAHYLSLAYALAGMADNFLIEYFVYRNPTLIQAHPTPDEVARFLTTLWIRALYLTNPPDTFLDHASGFKLIGARSDGAAPPPVR